MTEIYVKHKSAGKEDFERVLRETLEFGLEKIGYLVELRCDKFNPASLKKRRIIKVQLINC